MTIYNDSNFYNYIENIPNNEPSVCPRSSDPFYVVTYYLKWVTTSWTYSINKEQRVEF